MNLIFDLFLNLLGLMRKHKDRGVTYVTTVITVMIRVIYLLVVVKIIKKNVFIIIQTVNILDIQCNALDHHMLLLATNSTTLFRFLGLGQYSTS
jgi:type IV secretory pathway TrbL component